MKVSHSVTVVGCLLLLLGILFAGNWFFTSDPVPTQTNATAVVASSDGLAMAAVSSDSGVRLTPLSPWQAVAFDGLAETYLGGYELNGPPAAFATPIDFEMRLSDFAIGIPTVFTEISGITLPVDDVTYVYEGGVLRSVRASVPGPGRVYLVQQHVFYEEPAVLSGSVDAISSTVINESFTTALRLRLKDDIGAYGVINGQELGHLIDPTSVTLTIDINTTSSSVSPNSEASVVSENGLDVTDALIPIESSITCEEAAVVPIEVIVRMDYTASSYVRTVQNWVAHFNRQSEWNPSGVSPKEHSLTIIDRQYPECI